MTLKRVLSCWAHHVLDESTLRSAKVRLVVELHLEMYLAAMVTEVKIFDGTLWMKMNLCKYRVTVVKIIMVQKYNGQKNDEQYQKYHFLVILQEKARS